MKKIVFGITNLNIGGAERVLVDLVNQLKDQYEITIFTVYGSGDLEVELNSKTKRITLIKKKYEEMSLLRKKLMSMIFSSKLMLKFIFNLYIKNKYDTEVAFLEGPITSLFANSSKASKIAWVHTNLVKHLHSSYRINQYQASYSKYQQLIFISQDALDGFNQLFNLDINKKIIHNYMNTKNIVKKSLAFRVKELDRNTINFVSVCRLVPAKGMDRLILISKKLIEDGYNHKIYIVGDGPEHQNLKDLIKSLNLKDHFLLLGQKENPYPYIKKSDYFILPSLYEGYGMVLIEAMCLGKSIITTNTGAIEALKDYHNKLVADNSFEGLYQAMKTVINGKYKFDQANDFNYDNKTIIDEVTSIL